MGLLSLGPELATTTVELTVAWLVAHLLSISDVMQECLYSTMLEVELQMAVKTMDMTRWAIKHQAVVVADISPQGPTANRKLMIPR